MGNKLNWEIRVKVNPRNMRDLLIVLGIVAFYALLIDLIPIVIFTVLAVIHWIPVKTAILASVIIWLIITFAIFGLVLIGLLHED